MVFSTLITPGPCLPRSLHSCTCHFCFVFSFLFYTGAQPCEHKERLGVCLDTCHISDAGYDVSDFDEILKEFDRIIGLDRLLVVHVNDTKNPIGAHKDRHENIGYGYLGFETLYKVVNHPLLRDIPKILETPYYNEKAPYKQEIEMLRSGKYVDNWRD